MTDRAMRSFWLLTAAMLVIAADLFPATAVVPAAFVSVAFAADPSLPDSAPAPAQAAPAATQPAPAAAQPAGEIPRLVADLADADAQVRDAARMELMGLERKDLASLRQVIEANRPLAPSQAVVLHDIVTHVYLASENERSSSNNGFLGVRLAPLNAEALVADDHEVEAGRIAGVLIRECMPGFAGFRYLREGDVVIGVTQPIQMRTPQQQDLITAVSTVPPRETIRMEVLRQGRVIEVSFRVSARPREADEQLLTEELLNRRRAEAEAYWQEQFARLVSEGMS